MSEITKITPQMTVGDIKAVPELKEVADILIIKFNDIRDDMTLAEIGEGPRYDTGSLVMGVQRLLDLKRQGYQLNLPLYTEEEIQESPDRAEAALTFYRGNPGAPYVLICSGGGFVILTNLTEGFPTAARLNELGYNAFVLTYRVDQKKVIPKIQDDVAAAVKYIESHADELKVQAGSYAVCGFSAGGYNAASWGTKPFGYAKYGLPAPEAVFLSYAATSVEYMDGDFEFNDPLDLSAVVEAMLGENYTHQDVIDICLDRRIDEDYPPTFIWHCRDDESVPYSTAVGFKDVLDRYGVPCKVKTVEHGGHGLGLALNTEAEGWVEEALSFWNEHKGWNNK